MKLAFCEEGTSLHLVMSSSNEGRLGASFRLLDKEGKKEGRSSNPYESTMAVLCANETSEGVSCDHKIGAVRCHPPLSDNQLIFFLRKALLVDQVKPKTWRVARDTSLCSVPLMPPCEGETSTRYTPKTRPPLVRSVADSSLDVGRLPRETGLTNTPPRAYQSELFRLVMASERNSLVYLPTGLGKTLVAAMVLQRLLQLNPERQAFFLVETNALAIQQAAAVRTEMRCSVEMMVGSSMPLMGGNDAEEHRAQQRLAEIRAADVVVATAGAFEHAMLKHFIDPDSLCCVVLDEAHHCAKDHTFNRVTKSLLNSDTDKARSPERGASKVPKIKVVALTASPAGEKTLEATMNKIQALLKRLEADLVTPMETLPEVKERTPRVSLELVGVSTTAPEKVLFGCLEGLVLMCIIDLSPRTEAGIQAAKLLRCLKKRTNEPVESTASTGSLVPGADDSWRFPNKTYAALCQQAFALRSKEYLSEQTSGSQRDSENSGNILTVFMNIAFAVDEIGGEATWRWALDKLKKLDRANGGELDSALAQTIHILQKYVSNDCSEERRDVVDLSEPGSRKRNIEHGGLVGSKLELITLLLKEHKERCDNSDSKFSALVFVSTRELAAATAGMLEEVPALAPFVKAQHIVGLSEMTQAKQRVALESFRAGLTNVLVSTSVCGEGIDVPACALVVCASLPNSGTALVQLRGRIRCEENSRFVGLSRNCGEDDQEHVKTIFLREANMLRCIELRASGRAGF